MIVLGLLFLFPGFFRPVGDMPAAISWFSYLVPSSKHRFGVGLSHCNVAWGTQGSLNNALAGQKFDLPSGGSIDGMVIFTAVYKYSHNVKKWEDWLVVIAWAFFWRIVHYATLVYSNRSFGKSQV